MADILEAVFDPGVGLSFNTLIVRATHSAPAASAINAGLLLNRGNLVCLNLTSTDYHSGGGTISGTNNEGSSGYHMANGTGGGTVVNRDGVWGIVLDDGVAVGQACRVLVKGVVEAQIYNSLDTSTPAGTRCVVSVTTFNLNARGVAATAVPRKAVAITLEDADTNATSNTSAGGHIYSVLFDGFNGFGGSNDD